MIEIDGKPRDGVHVLVVDIDVLGAVMRHEGRVCVVDGLLYTDEGCFEHERCEELGPRELTDLASDHGCVLIGAVETNLADTTLVFTTGYGIPEEA